MIDLFGENDEIKEIPEGEYWDDFLNISLPLPKENTDFLSEITGTSENSLEKEEDWKNFWKEYDEIIDKKYTIIDCE